MQIRDTCVQSRTCFVGRIHFHLSTRILLPSVAAEAVATLSIYYVLCRSNALSLVDKDSSVMSGIRSGRSTLPLDSPSSPEEYLFSS
mmetsp:Transcript_909/g.1702  ORF Transcript_909/g.1702 Transcript_909/m.1702 type:complete len:87 (+) Transcript_909:49-309(+)